MSRGQWCRTIKVCDGEKSSKEKVIYSTGYIVPNLDEIVRVAGFNALVRRPSNIEDILRVIHQVLDAHE